MWRGQLSTSLSPSTPHIRIDTHAQNLPMQQAILAYGFQERGTIYLQDGSPRQAYDYLCE